MPKLTKVPNDAKEAIAEAVIVGRFRYAARLIFQWYDVMTRKDEYQIKDDVESYTQYKLEWSWLDNGAVVVLSFKGDRFTYRRQDVANERW